MKKIIRRPSPLHSKLKFLLDSDKDIIVTYNYPDRSVVKKTLSSNFLKIKGKVRKISDIINDLHAISHDKGAKFYI